jgi:hypothetical protein
MRMPGVPILAATLCLSPAFGKAAPPDFQGTWQLDKKGSDDMRAQIAQAAGPAQVKSGGASGLTILPEGGTRSEVERLELRAWLMNVAEQLDTLEIQQTPEELKLYNGDAVRIFYFGRSHSRQDTQGRMWKCEAKWQGEQLILEEEGDKKRRITEVFTVPAPNQLLHAIRFEDRLLKEPLSLRLMYRRKAAEAPPD